MGEEEVAAALFASRPRSFRMDRRSAGAASLKAVVSRKLVDFLGSYTDDVLAEYIVVLVCNGKHQNQARDDLEAFLGDDSDKFVAWLWHHLSEEASLLNGPTSISGQKADAIANYNGDVSKEQQNGALTDLQMQSAITSGILLSKDGEHGSSNDISAPNLLCGLKVAEDVPRRHVGLAVLNNELQEHACRIDRPCGPNNGKNSDFMTYKSTRVQSVEASVGSEQSRQLEDSYWKIGSSKCNNTPRESLEQEPNTRTLRSLLTEDSHLRHQSLAKVASGRLSPEATNSVSHQILHPRGSVWDRLGKPGEDTNVSMNERVHQHGLDAVKRAKLDHSGEGFDKRRLAPPLNARIGKRACGEIVLLENNHVRSESSNNAAEHRKMDCNIYIMDRGAGAVDPGKKRQFGDKDHGNGPAAFSDHRDSRHLEDKETCQKLPVSISVNSIPKQSLKQVTAENSIPSKTACNSSKSVKVLHNSTSNEVSQLQARAELSVPTSSQDPAAIDKSVQTKADSVNNPEHAASYHKPVGNEVLNMKQRLHQIEREMLELRSKQTSMNTDAKVLASQGSSLKNYSEEDADARTVFVTNVHFAAPKEALSSHFTQCGPVVRVVLLTEPITGQPKGSAYIVFANKESADKAISLSGTSFFSRTLKVMRKVDVPAGILAPTQAAGKPLNQAAGRPPRPWFSPQSQGKGSFQRQLSGHLQWRRDQASGGESQSAPTTETLEASSAAD